MQKQVIAFKYLPSRLPIWTTVVTYLLLDRFKSPSWVWGAVGVIVIFVWIACIVGMYYEVSYNPFTGEKE